MLRQDPNQRKWISDAASIIGLPLQLVASTALGYLFGAWLDRKFGTDPWLMLLFSLMGIVGGFIEIIRAANRISGDR